MFVTRVIYVENPNEALPVNDKPGDEQQWVEAPHGADPLAVADEMGRPVAILRIGGRVPIELRARRLTPVRRRSSTLRTDAA